MLVALLFTSNSISCDINCINSSMIPTSVPITLVNANDSLVTVVPEFPPSLVTGMFICFVIIS